jgi:CSLREA domain-containing protein
VTHAFVRPAGGAVTVLGTLGGATSSARAVNDFGEVVGNSVTAAGASWGFVWDGSAMVPLDMSGLTGDPISKCAAADINNLGQVAGVYSRSGGQRAYVLTLRPPLVVNTTDDNYDGSCAGHCSLREAMALANSTPGRDAIHFNIPGAGPHRITPTWDLPVITDPVLIDGTSQPGYGSSPRVEIDGAQPQPGAIDSGVPGPYHGLRVGSSHAVVRGLAVISFPGAGVHAQGESLILQGCFIGVDASGTKAAGNGRGVYLGSERSLVGGWPTTARNVIAGNMTGVVLPVDAWPATIASNHIGVDVTGAPLGNTGNGIYIGDRAKYGTRIIGNVIAHNGQDGVHHVMNIPPPGDDSAFWKHRTLILSNRIFDNYGEGITGVWAQQPLVDAATSATSTVEVRVAGAGKEILVQLFANTSCDPSGYGEGEIPIGQATVTTAATGWTTASIAVLPGFLVPGQYITATATDRSLPRTSEFSNCIPVDGAPTPPGGSILVAPTDGTTQTTPVSITFDAVTESGFTTVTSSGACATPEGFKLGEPPVCYDVSTTAETSGDALVCVSYQEGQYVDEDRLELFHLEQDPATGTETWVARTVSRDTAANVICAEVSSFSPFVVAEVADGVGPAVKAVALAPNPAPTGAGVALGATIDDSSSGASDVSSAAFSLSGGAPVAMAAKDGAFDDPTEQATASLGPFSSPGVHELCVSGTDAHGNTGPASCMPLVIYDPSAGFVTGGGWIDSPAGAYKPDPTLSGKAQFGFVSRYKKGATAPSGDVQFTFKAAGLAFLSKSFEWLVVAGAKAQLKGLGTLGGAGSYGFLLTAVDGQVPGGGTDRFRVKIWDKATDTVIYDNKTGAADTTALGGGSIVIHTP